MERNDSIQEAYDYLEEAWDRGDFEGNYNLYTDLFDLIERIDIQYGK